MEKTKNKNSSSGKRELIAPKGDKRYAKRNSSGKFSEMDDQSKSLGQDVKKKAKTKTKAGYGDKGDRGK